jgi:sec-independent protein translocase protein TatC
MNVYKYYLEIKNRLLLLTLSWISAILVSYCFKEVLLFIVTKHNIFSSHYTEETFYFIFTDVTEVFSVYITLIFFLGNQILIFHILYHLLVFIALGLYKSEYNYLTFVFKISVCFFFLSVIVFNKVLFPFSWDFFLSFQNFKVLTSLTLHFEAKLSEYLLFYIMFYHICIFYFQTFMLLILFFDYVKNELSIIKSFRKVFYYSFVIFSTLITPPDVFSQFILSTSIIISYEILMFCIIVKNLIR